MNARMDTHRVYLLDVNSTTAVHKRTLAEAFADCRATWIEGPTADERRQRTAKWVVIGTCIAAMFALGVMAVFGWLPGGSLTGATS